MNSPLFEPIGFGSNLIKNRFVMGAMHTGLEKLDGLVRLTEFYKRRAEGGVGLIVTGGFSPDEAGMIQSASSLWNDAHARLVDEVHRGGAKICLQILHPGRCWTESGAVAPSAIRSPISPMRPRQLADDEVVSLIHSYGELAKRAIEVGYDGIEINGAEGFLVSQFLAERSNTRSDRWGGSFENRARFARLLTREVRERIDSTKILSFRLSLMDLVEGGGRWSEVVQIAQWLQSDGVSVFNTAVGWNESRIPTVSGVVPRAAFADIARSFKQAVSIPVIAGGRVNSVESAEMMLNSGACDMVSMARAFLADPAFVKKASRGERAAINTCIACNQTCLDRTFTRPSSESTIVSCLLNPWACHETAMSPLERVSDERAVGVVGAGPAGLATAIVLAMRGYKVCLYEASSSLGGQFLMASHIPGKHEYLEAIRYAEQKLMRLGVNVQLNTMPTIQMLSSYEHVFLATGTKPKHFSLSGSSGSILSYREVLADRNRVGHRVAIVGAGPVAFDIADFLSHDVDVDHENTIQTYHSRWQIDPGSEHQGQILGSKMVSARSSRKICILQRKPGIVSGDLGLTTGWIKRDILLSRGVSFFSDAEALSFDSDCLRIRHGEVEQELFIDTLVVCIGAERNLLLVDALESERIGYTLVGAVKGHRNRVDAEFSIRDGVQVALGYRSEVG